MSWTAYATTAFAATADTAKYGTTAPAASALRQIVITEKTRHVRVESDRVCRLQPAVSHLSDSGGVDPAGSTSRMTLHRTDQCSLIFAPLSRGM